MLINKRCIASYRQNMKKIKTAAIFFLFFFCALFPSFSDVKIKFVAMNPNELKEQTFPIRYDLPRGIKAEDVIDTGDFDLQYDMEEDKYFVEKEVTLQPKESKVFELLVKDIWRIPEEKLDLLREHIRDKFTELEEIGVSDKAEALKNSMLKRLDEIAVEQDEAESIDERIKLYGTNVKKLDAIENDMLVLSGIGVDIAPPKTVNIIVEVTNRKKTPYKYNFRHYFLREINSPDVVDTGGLTLGYDMERRQLYVHGEMEFAPQETKRIVLKVRDIWHIKDPELNAMEAEYKKILEQLVDTEYDKLGTYLGEEIDKILADIREKQAKEETIERRIATYKENLKSYATAKSYLDKLRSFMLQFELARAGQEGKPTDKPDTAETFGGGASEGKGGGVGKGIGTALGEARGQTVRQRGGGVQGIRGLKGIILVSRSLFKGWKPELATTWFIILTIVGILAFLAILFYIVSIVLSLREKKTKKVGESGENR